MRSVLSPWAEAFDNFVRSIHHRAIVVSPFITERPLQQFGSLLHRKSTLQISLLTNLDPDSMLRGSLDTRAVANLCKEFPTTVVRHLPGLHAKAYVADEHTAIITSGNLTDNSLHRNYEYGIEVSDPKTVKRIASDLMNYGSLGIEITLNELYHLAEISDSLRDKHSRALNSARGRFKEDFERQLETTVESLRRLRAKPGESTNSIFARTLLYVLKEGPLETSDIHPIIHNIHPDLCDDRINRVINGVRFGREWKHRVRSAQAKLKRRGLIELSNGKWRLTQKNDHDDPDY